MVYYTYRKRRNSSFVNSIIMHPLSGTMAAALTEHAGKQAKAENGWFCDCSLGIYSLETPEFLAFLYVQNEMRNKLLVFRWHKMVYVLAKCGASPALSKSGNDSSFRNSLRPYYTRTLYLNLLLPSPLWYSRRYEFRVEQQNFAHNATHNTCTQIRSVFNWETARTENHFTSALFDAHAKSLN